MNFFLETLFETGVDEMSWDDTVIKKILIYCFTITFGYTLTAWMLPGIYMNFQFAKLQISIWQLNYRFSYFLCSDNLNI